MSCSVSKIIIHIYIKKRKKITGLKEKDANHLLAKVIIERKLDTVVGSLKMIMFFLF